MTPRNAIRPLLKTKAQREFWDFVARTSREVRANEPYWLTPKQRVSYWRLVDEGKQDMLEDFGESGC